MLREWEGSPAGDRLDSVELVPFLYMLLVGREVSIYAICIDGSIKHLHISISERIQHIRENKLLENFLLWTVFPRMACQSWPPVMFFWEMIRDTDWKRNFFKFSLEKSVGSTSLSGSWCEISLHIHSRIATRYSDSIRDPQVISLEPISAARDYHLAYSKREEMWLSRSGRWKNNHMANGAPSVYVATFLLYLSEHMLLLWNCSLSFLPTIFYKHL